MKKNSKKHSTRNWITALVILAVFIGTAFFLRWNSRVQFYSDESVTGNTSANLLNGGRFAESGDKIYFANPYDQNALYSMDTDLTNVKKLYSDYTGSINAAGKYIFYTRRNDKKGHEAQALFSFSSTGLYRLCTDGQSLKQLYREPTQTVSLLGNNIYYQHYDKKEGLQLFSVGIDGSKNTMLVKEGVSPVIADNTIYYTGIDSDHNIHKLSVSGGSPSVVYEGNFTGLSYQDNMLYCMDMDNDYTLCRIDLSSGTLTHLTQERVATYNISSDGSIVYYQIDNGKDNGLYAMDIDSGTQTQLRPGNFNYLHIIDKYLFFEEYDGSKAYVMNLSNEQIDDFQPAVRKK